MLDSLSDCLFVVNLRRTLVDIHTELTTKTVNDDVKVKLTHTADDSLAGLVVSLDCEGRVLLSKLCESDTEFVKVFLSLRFYSKSDNRIRELHRLKSDRTRLNADGITCAEILETYCSADITGLHEVDRILFV